MRSPTTRSPTKRSAFGWLRHLYGVLMMLVAVALLGLFLACVVDGAVRLAVFEDLSGFGLMALGVPLYFGGELALAESDAAWGRRVSEGEMNRAA